MIRAALLTPLSGPLAGYGRAGAAALDLWRQWHPQRVELAVLDAHPDPARAVRQVERQRPDLLFGPYGSGLTGTVARTTSRLVFNHGGARVEAADNLISILAPAETYFHGALQSIHARGRRCQRVCLLHGTTGFGRAVAGGALGEAARLGMDPVVRTIPADPADADILLVAGGFAGERAIAHRWLPGRWHTVGFVGAGVEDVLAELGERREGLLGPAQWLPSAAPVPDEGPTAAAFVAAYRRATGADPPYPAAQAFAAGLIAARCLHEAGTPDEQALLAAAQTLHCTTMFARFTLDPTTHRQVGHRVLTVQWQHGARRVLWPPDQAQATLR